MESILVCPICHSKLMKDLTCGKCGAVYVHNLGVYDLLSEKLSGDQQSLWGIDESVFANDAELQAHAEQQKANIEDYHAHMNDETKTAQSKLREFTDSALQEVSGVVCDLATGNGGMLANVLEKSKAEIIVCTDIDPLVLARTRIRRKTDDKKVFYVASDGRYMSLQDNSFDYVTSLAGLGNVPETEKVVAELYRILKPGGSFLMESTYMEAGSRSHAIAKEYQLDKGLIEEELIACLHEAGFAKVESTVVDTAIWAENPYDLLPVAGDRQKYCLIKATK